MIACVQVPFFAAAVERQHLPSLAGEPLVLLGTHKVDAVSEAAFQQGVLPGMSVAQAEATCAEAHQLRASPSRYRRAFQKLVRVLSTFSPTIEAANTWNGGPYGLAHCYVDLGRLKPLAAMGMAQTLSQTVHGEAGLPVSVALAEGKFPAAMAAACGYPAKALLVGLGHEADFLSPLPVNLLPLDRETGRQFALLGIRTMGDLAALPSDAVLARFGYDGRFWQKLAQGQDDRPLRSHVHQEELQVGRQLDEPVAGAQTVEAITGQLVGELVTELHRADLMAGELSLCLQLEDGGNQEASLSLPQATANACELLARFQTLLDRLTVSSGITGVALTCAGLSPIAGRQLDLFPHDGGQRDRLVETLPGLLRRFGPDSFYWVELAGQPTHFPEERFRLRAVRP